MSTGTGKRGKPKQTTGDRLKSLDQRLSNNEMGVRVMQMVTKQIGETLQPMQNDLGELASRQRDLQYILLALQDLTGINKDVLDSKAIELQVRDFEEASDKEDLAKGYTKADLVEEDSAVIISSKTPEEEEDKGIMRSKLLLSEIRLPLLKEALLGKKVGESTEAEVNGVKHLIEILGVRKVPAPEAPEALEASEALESPLQGDLADGQEEIQQDG